MNRSSAPNSAARSWRPIVVADRPAVRCAITGRAWITGFHQHVLDPSDPAADGIPAERYLATGVTPGEIGADCSGDVAMHRSPS